MWSTIKKHSKKIIIGLVLVVITIGLYCVYRHFKSRR